MSLYNAIKPNQAWNLESGAVQCGSFMWDPPIAPRHLVRLLLKKKKKIKKIKNLQVKKCNKHDIYCNVKAASHVQSLYVSDNCVREEIILPFFLSELRQMLTWDSRDHFFFLSFFLFV